MIIIEGKNIGPLYHFTDDLGLNGFINDGGLKSPRHNFISFTRSFTPPKDSHLKYSNVRLTFNGIKLSNKYKIKPYADTGFDEAEEIITWPKFKILPCQYALIRIDILKKSDVKDYTEQEIEDYKKIKLPIYFVDRFKRN